jgi:hypothetical protein
VRGQEREDSLVNPPALSELHGHLKVGRNEREEVGQRGELVGAEVGAELGRRTVR